MRDEREKIIKDDTLLNLMRNKILLLILIVSIIGVVNSANISDLVVWRISSTWGEFSDNVTVNTIKEYTSGSGVDVDGCLIKDGVAAASNNTTYIGEVHYTLVENTTRRGQANGYASLDGSGDVPLSQIPDTLTGKDADTLDGYNSSDFLFQDADTLDGYNASELYELQYESGNYSFFTTFNTLDGVGTSTSGTGAVILGWDNLTLATGSTANSHAEVYDGVDRDNSLRRSALLWTADRFFKIRFLPGSITNQNISIVTGNLSGKYFGFKMINDTMYGVCNDGATETLVQLVTYPVTASGTWEARLYGGEKIEFYNDGSYQSGKDITTNLPTSGDYAGQFYDIKIENLANENKYIKFVDFELWCQP